MAPLWQHERWPWLHRNATTIPVGLRPPKSLVSGGCGQYCNLCYEIDTGEASRPDDVAFRQLANLDIRDQCWPIPITLDTVLRAQMLGSSTQLARRQLPAIMLAVNTICWVLDQNPRGHIGVTRVSHEDKASSTVDIDPNTGSHNTPLHTTHLVAMGGCDPNHDTGLIVVLGTAPFLVINQCEQQSGAFHFPITQFTPGVEWTARPAPPVLVRAAEQYWPDRDMIEVAHELLRRMR